MSKSQGSKTTTNSTIASTGGNTSKAVDVSQSKKPVSVSAEIKPSIDDLRRRAYEIYLKRQSAGSPGSPDSDWKQAERELNKR